MEWVGLGMERESGPSEGKDLNMSWRRNSS